MNKTALMLLSIASVAGVVGLATATPFTANDTQSQGYGNLVREAGLNVSDVARGVGLANIVQEGGFSAFGTRFPLGPGVSIGVTAGGDASTATPSIPTSFGTPGPTVPEGGSTLLLLGAGILALGLLRHHGVQHS